MFEISCLDSYGNTINNFTQWDVDQEINIVLNGCDKDYLSIPPNVHFCNVKSTEALVVRSVVVNESTINVRVPNILLQESYPLLVYVYLTDSVDVSSQKTILTTEIPVRKRVKPANYTYVENIERITAKQIKKEIKHEIVAEINSNDIMFDSFTLVDVTTGKPYKIYASNQRLYVDDQVDLNDVPLNSVTFFDADSSVDRKYKVYLTDGKMMLETIEETTEEIESEV